MPLLPVFIGAATTIAVSVAVSGGIAAVIAGIGGILAGAAAITAVTYVIGALNKSEGFTLNLGLRDRSFFQATPEVPRNIVYGEADVAPRILRVFTHDADGLRTLHILCAVADHPVEAITAFYINGERFLTEEECATLASATGVSAGSSASSDFPAEALRNKVSEATAATSASPSPFYAIASLSGTPFDDLQSFLEQRLFPLPTLTPDDAFDDHRMTGMSWVYMRFTNTLTNPRERLIWEGSPQVKVRVRRGGANLAPIGSLSDYEPLTLLASRTDADMVYSGEQFGVRFTYPFVDWSIGGKDYVLESIRFHDVRAEVQIGSTDGRALPSSEFNYLPANARMAIYNATSRRLIAEGPLLHFRSTADIYFTTDLPAGVAAEDGDLMQIYVYAKNTPLVDIGEIGAGDTNHDNAALCCFDYLSRHTSYGDTHFGDPQINAEAFDVAAIICEERGWKANGVFTLDDSPDAVLAQFEQAMVGGFIVDRGGVVEARAGGPRLSSFDITEDMVLPGWGSAPSLPRENRSSIISVEYSEATPDGDLIRSVSLANDRAVDTFGEITSRSESLLISNRKQAVQHAQVQLLRQWESMQVSLVCNAAPIGLGPSDTCTLTLPALGIKGKKFRVLGASYNADLSVALDLYEEDDAAWNSIPEGTTSINPPVIPNVDIGVEEEFVAPSLIWSNAAFVAGDLTPAGARGWGAATHYLSGGTAAGELGVELGGAVRTLNAVHWAPAGETIDFSTVEDEAEYLSAIEPNTRIVMWRTKDNAIFCDASFARNVGTLNVGTAADASSSFYTRTVLSQRSHLPADAEGFGLAVYTASQPIGSIGDLGL